MQIVRGTLRASPTFPSDRWLVEIGSSSCDPRLPSGAVDVQGSCGQFINLNEMMFDASHVAAGGVSVSKTMGTTIGPSVFFTGFTTAGVQINGGHECMIQQVRAPHLRLLYTTIAFSVFAWQWWRRRRWLWSSSAAFSRR